MDELLGRVKLALRIVTDAFDDELTDLIDSCIADIRIAGIDTDIIGADYLNDPNVIAAVITYCKLNFGKVGSADYDRLKASYDEQKKQLGMAEGYTDWGVD